MRSPAPRSAWPRVALRVLVGVAAAALIVAACGSTSAQLSSLLPPSVLGAPVMVTVVTVEAPLSGVAADDILAVLGKERSDASITMGEWATGVVTLMTVTDVTSERLLEAAATGWDASATEVPPAPGIPADVRVLEIGGGRCAYLRIVGSAVAIVETASSSEAAAVFAALAP